jgi:hypothetical protein
MAFVIEIKKVDEIGSVKEVRTISGTFRTTGRSTGESIACIPWDVFVVWHFTSRS